MTTVLIYLVTFLPLVAALFLARRKPNIASGLFLVGAAGAIVVAATRPPFLLSGLFYTFFAAVLAISAILINHPLYTRIFQRATRRTDEHYTGGGDQKN